jgi:hypothetical protein
MSTCLTMTVLFVTSNDWNDGDDSRRRKSDCRSISLKAAINQISLVVNGWNWLESRLSHFIATLLQYGTVVYFIIYYLLRTFFYFPLFPDALSKIFWISFHQVTLKWLSISWVLTLLIYLDKEYALRRQLYCRTTGWLFETLCGGIGRSRCASAVFQTVC